MTISMIKPEGNVMTEQRTIATIDTRLKVWAEYISAQANGSPLGRNQLAVLMESAGDFIASTAPDDGMPDYVDATDKAVRRIQEQMPALWLVIREHYVYAEKLDDQRFKAVGCSRATYYRRLAQAHQAVLFQVQGQKRTQSAMRVSVRQLRKAG